MSQQKTALSLVVPVFNEADNLPEFHRQTTAVLEKLGLPWEVLFINDGSQDHSLEVLLALHQSDARMKVIDFSRNFGKEAALAAGFHAANGDALIPMDADLQHPPELIPILIAKWREGFDVVNAVRANRPGESWFRRLSSNLFYFLINRMSRFDMPRDVSDFRLLSRPVVDVLNALPERRRFTKGLVAWTGFRIASVPYQQAPRHAGTSAWSYFRLMNYAVEGITAFSTVPLQLASVMGFLVASLSLLYALFIVGETLLFGNPVPGYPSLIVAILFLGGVQLIALGVIGEYLGRVHEEVRKRPMYVVRKRWGKIEECEQEDRWS